MLGIRENSFITGKLHFLCIKYVECTLLILFFLGFTMRRLCFLYHLQTIIWPVQCRHRLFPLITIPFPHKLNLPLVRKSQKVSKFMYFAYKRQMEVAFVNCLYLSTTNSSENRMIFYHFNRIAAQFLLSLSLSLPAFVVLYGELLLCFFFQTSMFMLIIWFCVLYQYSEKD